MTFAEYILKEEREDCYRAVRLAQSDGGAQARLIALERLEVYDLMSHSLAGADGYSSTCEALTELSDRLLKSALDDMEAGDHIAAIGLRYLSSAVACYFHEADDYFEDWKATERRAEG